jgi:hypothetical protein
MGREMLMRGLENGFTKKFSVNRFPHFPLLFSGKKQIFSC